MSIVELCHLRPQKSGFENGRTAGEKDWQTAGEKAGRTAGEKDWQAADERAGRTAGEKDGQTAGEKAGRTAGERAACSGCFRFVFHPVRRARAVLGYQHR